MAESFSQIETRLLEIDERLRQIDILIRVNNLIISKFILQLSNLKKQLNIKDNNDFFKFSILQTDYEELVNQYGKQEVDKVLYRLDRMLILNKINCPNNIKNFVIKKLKKNSVNGRTR